MSGGRPDPWRWREQLSRDLRVDPGRMMLPVVEAAGWVLADEVRSPEAIPPLPVSAMDGFAVRRGDLAVGRMTLPVACDIPARPGSVPPLPAGSAARIMTGAPVPAGADVVIPVELTDAAPTGAAPASVAVTLEELPAPGRHIRARGEEVAQDALLAPAGARVGPGLIGLACATGVQALPVRAPARVAIVVTGDELAMGTATSPGAAEGIIRESNAEMLAAAIALDGALPRVLHCGDDPAELQRVLDDAASDAHLVVTTGGIGHGAYDVVKELLGESGRGTSRFEHLALRPGGPQGYGLLRGDVPVVHLPGTPVGALVGFHLFVRQLLATVCFTTARLTSDAGAKRPAARRTGLQVLPGRLSEQEGQVCVEALPGRRLAPYGIADALILFETPGPSVEGRVRILRLT